MKRPVRPEELRLWSMVAATIHPLPGRKVAPAPAPAEPARADATPVAKAPPKFVKPSRAAIAAPTPIPAPARPQHPWNGPENIEPRRKHRIARERDPIGARIDLHGLDYDQARAALESFVRRAWDQGYRAVLVITGKGSRGGGVLRRAAPEWLAAPQLREVVAGISEAHRKHGGEGALYVALKRKTRT